MSSPPSENPFQSPEMSVTAANAAPQEIVTDGLFTAEDLYLAYQNQTTPTWRRLFLTAVGCGMLSIALGLGVVGTLVTLASVAIAGPLAMWMLGRFLFMVLPQWSKKRRELKNSPRRQRVVLSANGVSYASPESSAQYPWSSFQKITASRQLFAMYSPQTLSWISIPRRAFESEEDFHAAVQLARTQIALKSRSQTHSTELETSTQDTPPPEGAIVGQGAPTVAEFKIARRVAMRVSTLAGAIIGGCVMFVTAISVFPFMPKDLGSTELIWFSILVLSGGSVVIIGWRIWQEKIIRQAKRQEQGFFANFRWTITQESIQADKSGESFRLHWSDFSDLECRNDWLVLYPKASESIFLSQRYFNSLDDWRQVIEWAQQSQRKH